MNLHCVFFSSQAIWQNVCIVISLCLFSLREPRRQKIKLELHSSSYAVSLTVFLPEGTRLLRACSLARSGAGTDDDEIDGDSLPSGFSRLKFGTKTVASALSTHLPCGESMKRHKRIPIHI